MRATCLLIDHDDTLMSTFELRAAMTALAVEEVFGEVIDGVAFLVQSQGAQLEEMARAFTAEEALVDKYVSTYRDHYYAKNTEGLHVFDGVQATLEALVARGVPIGVVTSKLGSGAQAEHKAAGLDHLFPVVIGAEHVTKSKPDAEPLLRALARLDHPTHGTLMVGDTTADILAAQAAGVVSVAALWGAQDKQGLLAAAPDKIAETPHELLALF